MAGPAGLIPAREGNTGRLQKAVASRWAHPRSRGEHKVTPYAPCFCSGSSPLARGPPGTVIPGRRWDGLIPARAGTIRGLKSPGGRARAHPRSRGEQHQKADVLRVCLRLIPTRVGNMTRHIRIRHLHEVHPRSRGEHTVRACKSAPTKGSSPLAQGISRLLGIGLWVVRLTPARAGNMPAGVFLVLRPSAHPRSRGEHDMVFTPPKSVSGSSPLARGTFPVSVFIHARDRLIPARAGNMGCCRRYPVQAAAHPRSRGEHSRRAWWCWKIFGSSPLARGTSHKRLRGALEGGSSPLARGTYITDRPAGRRQRLIPARAGNISAEPD